MQKRILYILFVIICAFSFVKLQGSLHSQVLENKNLHWARKGQLNLDKEKLEGQLSKKINLVESCG